MDTLNGRATRGTEDRFEQARSNERVVRNGRLHRPAPFTVGDVLALMVGSMGVGGGLVVLYLALLG